MSERLKWGLEPYRAGTRIALHVPPEIIEAAAEKHPVQEVLQELSGRQLISQTTDDNHVSHLVVNTKTIGRIKNTPSKHDALQSVHELIGWTGVDPRYSSGGRGDPRMKLMSFYPTGSGDFGFAVAVKLPDTDDITLARCALKYMVGVAYDIRMLNNIGSYEQHFRTEVERRVEGISLSTSGHSSIHTMGEDFKPGSDTVELWGNNVWDDEEPLVYLAGSIALAYADVLATE